MTGALPGPAATGLCRGHRLSNHGENASATIKQNRLAASGLSFEEPRPALRNADTTYSASWPADPRRSSPGQSRSDSGAAPPATGVRANDGNSSRALHRPHRCRARETTKPAKAPRGRAPTSTACQGAASGTRCSRAGHGLLGSQKLLRIRALMRKYALPGALAPARLGPVCRLANYRLRPAASPPIPPPIQTASEAALRSLPLVRRLLWHVDQAEELEVHGSVQHHQNAHRSKRPAQPPWSPP